MWKHLQTLGEPLYTIKKDPIEFIIWIALLISIGLIGVWAPLIFDSLNEGNKTFLEIIINGSASTFALTILADGMINMFSHHASGKTTKTNTVRKAALALSIIFVFINLLLYSAIILNVRTNKLSYLITILTVLNLLTVSYLYCFRSVKWEDVKKYREEDDESAAELVTDEENISEQSEEGVEV